MAASVDSASRFTAGEISPAVPLPPANRTAAVAVASVHSRPGTAALAESDAARPAPGQAQRPGAPAHQPRPQPVPAAVQANLDRPQGPAERLRGFHLGPPLHVTEDDRFPIFFGKSIDFLVQLGVVEGIEAHVRGPVSVHDLGLSPLGGPPAGVFAPGASGHAERDPVQPGAERLGLADRTGVAGEDEEHRLRRVPGRLPIAKDVETDPMNDRTMALDEGGEGGFGRFVRPGEELSQELLVGPCFDRVTIADTPGSPALLPSPRAPWVASLLGCWSLHSSGGPRRDSISEIPRIWSRIGHGDST